MTTWANGEISEKDFNQFINQAKAVVEFYTPTCAPCRQLEPVLAELSKKTGIPVARINALEAPHLTEEYWVIGVPALFYFKNGKLVKELRGCVSGEKLYEFFYY